MITPFDGSGSIDKGALCALVDRQIESGIDGLTPMGTTGESPTVSSTEHVAVIRWVVKQAAGRAPIIAGAGSNSTDEAIDMTLRAKDSGATMSLQVTPYYNRPNQEGLYRHFSTIADKTQMPIILYNIPSRTGRNIETATIARLARHDWIVGVKEASGSIAQVMEVVAATLDEEFIVLSGDDNLILPIIAMGGRGVISVAANLVPERITALTRSALDGDMETARRLQWQLLPLFRAIFMDTNPIPIKRALALKGWCEERYRLPLCPMPEEMRPAFDAVLRELNLL